MTVEDISPVNSEGVSVVLSDRWHHLDKTSTSALVWEEKKSTLEAEESQKFFFIKFWKEQRLAYYDVFRFKSELPSFLLEFFNWNVPSSQTSS